MRDPMKGWLEQEVLDRDPVSPDQERTRRPEGLSEGGDSWRDVSPAAALHFDRDHRAPGSHDEVHLAVTFAPVEDLALASSGCRPKV